ncbi:MAG: phosphoglycerate kinase, partial [Candidatus Pacebacteria bacterium]|nr:phosphoglycerate kinase [Candidatus Paceibacterota bacterium]
MNLKSVSEIEHIEGRRIILRSDLNEPIENGVVRDTYRILRALPTIQFLT